MAQQQQFINSAALGEEYKVEDMLKAGKVCLPCINVGKCLLMK
jgi:hypothetical protein